MILMGFFESIPSIFFQRISDSAVLALATLGIVLIYRTSFTTNFAQGTIAAFSAYIMFMFSQIFLQDLGLSYQLAFVLGLIIAIIAAFIIGFSIDTLIIRRAKKVSSSGKQMITMGMVLVLTALTDIFFSPMIERKINRVLPEPFRFNLFGNTIIFNQHNFVTTIVAILVIALIFLLLQKTRWGLSVRATASNELITSMMGVNTRMITAMSWAIAGMLGALAAVFFAPTSQGGTLSPHFMTNTQVNAFLALILGGANTFIGPVVAAVLIPIVLGFAGYFNALWQNVILYVVILIVILILPNGIFGKKVVKKV